MPLNSLPDLHEIPEHVWIFLAKSLGAICGSAISIAYLLPASRREAVLRFVTGISVGMIFGTFTGLKLADQLGLTERISSVEIALSGAAMSSLCAWWGLGAMARIAARLGKAKHT